MEFIAAPSICVLVCVLFSFFSPALVLPFYSINYVCTYVCKTIFQAWKVMENSEGHGKSWKMIITSCNSVKVTQIMNRNVILLTQFALVYLLTNFL